MCIRTIYLPTIFSREHSANFYGTLCWTFLRRWIVFAWKGEAERERMCQWWRTRNTIPIYLLTVHRCASRRSGNMRWDVPLEGCCQADWNVYERRKLEFYMTAGLHIEQAFWSVLRWWLLDTVCRKHVTWLGNFNNWKSDPCALYQIIVTLLIRKMQAAWFLGCNHATSSCILTAIASFFTLPHIVMNASSAIDFV